ncbi:hypothetical protein PI125_g19067 [Phytophthora idaei]|nr:hypothetical protein PI125_g19067 [Phytophthora idaei]KAG3141721.1 hypothetical protein PI126_g15362 [Phytophthora idaei]
MTDLPLKLGSLEMMLTFIVVSRFHVDAILDTDTLKAFRAVINLDSNTMTLKDTGEAFRLEHQEWKSHT